MLELGGPVPWPLSGPDARFVPAALGGSLRARSFALDGLDGLDGLALVVLVAAARTEPSHIRRVLAVLTYLRGTHTAA